MLANDAPRPAEEHRGYEISYAPASAAGTSAPTPMRPARRNSYRSAFQARRAIDEILDAPAPVAAGGKKKKG